MPHYRSLMDHEFLGAWDLSDPKTGKGREFTLTIAKVEVVPVIDQEKLRDRDVPKDQKTSDRLTVTFEKTDKRLLISKTLGDCIAALHGSETNDWVGKKVTLYPAQTQFGRDRVDCVRVKLDDETLRNSPRIRRRVREKLLAERGWTAVQPKTRDEREKDPTP